MRPALRCLVQPRVLDRHGRLSRQQTDEILVFGIEVDATRLFGQVEVAVGDAAQHDRNAQERPHRRMIRRETNRTRVVAERAKTQRLDIADQHPEDPTPARKSADRLDLLATDAVRDETLQLVAVTIDDAERGVSRPRQLSRNPHQPLEKLIEGQCGAQGDTRTDENPQPVVPIELGLAHPHHYPERRQSASNSHGTRRSRTTSAANYGPVIGAGPDSNAHEWPDHEKASTSRGGTMCARVRLRTLRLARARSGNHARFDVDDRRRPQGHRLGAC